MLSQVVNTSNNKDKIISFFYIYFTSYGIIEGCWRESQKLWRIRDFSRIRIPDLIVVN